MLCYNKGFTIFQSSRSCIQNPYAELYHFRGVESAALMSHSMLQTVATCNYMQTKLKSLVLEKWNVVILMKKLLSKYGTCKVNDVTCKVNDVKI